MSKEGRKEKKERGREALSAPPPLPFTANHSLSLGKHEINIMRPVISRGSYENPMHI